MRTNLEAEKKIRHVVATMAMEEMHCTAEEVKELRKIAKGEINVEDSIRMDIQKYSVG